MQSSATARFLAIAILLIGTGLCHGKGTNVDLMKRLLDYLRKDFDKPLLAKRAWPASCGAQYSKMSTMCQYMDSSELIDGSVSDAWKQSIVDQHNRYRAAVSPPAANMAKMYWDQSLGLLAQKWANTCPASGHDTDENRMVPGYGVAIGQNIGWASANWTMVIGDWYAEMSRYVYGSTPNYQKIGQYTQLVRDMAMRVGCGYSHCSSGMYYVCNYVLGNAYDLAHPYESGSSCAKCPNNCRGKLCDCNGVLCKNGGVLDQNMCTCGCMGAWTGPDCGRPTGGNVTKPCKAVVCKHGGVLDQTTCACRCFHPWSGRNCGTVGPNVMNNISPSICTATTADKPYCAQYPEQYCTTYTGWRDLCPIKCGMCTVSVRCSGKTCQNGGLLTASCTCSCPPGWTGGACQHAVQNVVSSCSPTTKDAVYCHSYPQHYCSLYYYFPDKCPLKCGKCKVACPGKVCENGGMLQPDCSCKCPSGWSGQSCQNVVRCPGMQCKNGGHLESTCTCKCPSMFTGSACQYMVQCPGKMCQNGGILQSDCTCSCKSGWTGDSCQVMGRCPGKSANYCGTKGSLSAMCTCTCRQGFSGAMCEVSACGPDASYCAYFRQYCNHSYIKTTCKKMCGAC